MSKDNITLFVGDLSLFCNANHLKQAFSKFGEVTAVRIAFDEQSQKQLHFGFVEYSSYEAALNALTMMNGTVLCGRILRVKWAINRNEVSEEARRLGTFSMETSSVHVNFLSYQTEKLVSEESLRAVFGAFGEVKDVVIKKSAKENGTQRGYGFVHYGSNHEGIQSTLAAISNMYDVTVDNVNYTCAMSHSCEKGFRNAAAAASAAAAVSGASHSPHGSGHASPYMQGQPGSGAIDYYLPYVPAYAEAPPLQQPANQYFMYDQQGYEQPLMQNHQQPQQQQQQQQSGYPMPSGYHHHPHHHDQSMMGGAAPYYGVPSHSAPLMHHAPPSAAGSYMFAPMQSMPHQYGPPPAAVPPSYFSQQMPPMQSDYYRPEPALGHPRPRHLLLQSVGRSNSDPAPQVVVPARPSPRGFHSSNELSPPPPPPSSRGYQQAGSGPVTPLRIAHGNSAAESGNVGSNRATVSP